MKFKKVVVVIKKLVRTATVRTIILIDFVHIFAITVLCIDDFM